MQDTSTEFAECPSVFAHARRPVDWSPVSGQCPAQNQTKYNAHHARQRRPARRRQGVLHGRAKPGRVRMGTALCATWHAASERRTLAVDRTSNTGVRDVKASGCCHAPCCRTPASTARMSASLTPLRSTSIEGKWALGGGRWDPAGKGRGGGARHGVVRQPSSGTGAG